MPAAHVRLSAGREQMSDELQALCFIAGANSIFYGEKLLTTGNPDVARDDALFCALGIESAIWGGLFEVAPGARTGVHHHGEQETIAYVLSGICEIRWGERGESVARARAGDFIHVPAFLPHMEINPSDSEPFRWVVVRSTSTPIVVNLSDHAWPSAGHAVETIDG